MIRANWGAGVTSQPEIIEMSGHTGTACDIWSVGCTVIELLMGAPPYFDLPPMPALFRIVQVRRRWCAML